MLKQNMQKKPDAKTILFYILLVTLLGSVVFAAHMIVLMPASETVAAQGERLRSDYVLMLVECVLGLVVMFLPSLLERQFRVSIPNYIYILYFLFLYGAIYLGEVRSFYYLIPHWDTVLHAFSAMMLGALGFSLVSILNDATRTRVDLSPRFVGLFAFCFAVAAGVLWEIYEFSFDGLLGMNMQKFRLESGQALIGREALKDTMGDLITDTLGALLVSVLGALTIKKKKEVQKESRS